MKDRVSQENSARQRCGSRFSLPRVVLSIILLITQRTRATESSVEVSPPWSALVGSALFHCQHRYALPSNRSSSPKGRCGTTRTCNVSLGSIRGGRGRSSLGGLCRARRFVLAVPTRITDHTVDDDMGLQASSSRRSNACGD